ncbi:MAG: RNA-binding protein [candidate division KSB1 bacterium]|nr:RNA-binding protein [candidate division KSB1 bacterium]MDZ7336383.1 RNA-binding protein [candidate division KSB1 bacterium]MDZ7375831.1 RNA-binding protein [candidate division KSB1 bacterium]MDZ7401700.1 RNA-binding protein [candidate division KSB1 bacterium]
MNLYIGNLSEKVTDDDLRQTFETYGEVSSAKVITDRYTKASRGFGFVEMPVQQDALTAMDELNNTELKGKRIVVNEARQRTDKRRDSSSPGRRNSTWQNRY